MSRVKIGDRWVGPGEPAFIVAEAGINHNGDVDLAKQLVAAAQAAGCDSVKFQKRTPDLCVPAEQKNKLRETPWGDMTYLEYRHRIELDEAQYREIDTYCRALGIVWSVSVWDLPSVDFIAPFHPSYLKIPSAALTNDALLRRARELACPIVLSTGMSTLEQIQKAVGVAGESELILLHCTSSYPAKTEDLNLRVIRTLMTEFSCPIGYSGHEVGLQTTLAAATLGACFIERHLTLDRAMWGSDQASSVEPTGFARLTRDIRVIEKALGDGVKRVCASELPARKRLRGE
jgi:N-acetylneuraminate synthase